MTLGARKTAFTARAILPEWRSDKMLDWLNERGFDLRAAISKGVTMQIPATMTATVLVAPHRFELQQRAVPVPGDEDVLVRVRACGV